MTSDTVQAAVCRKDASPARSRCGHPLPRERASQSRNNRLIANWSTLRISPTEVKGNYRMVRGESENQNAPQVCETAPGGRERRHAWSLAGRAREEPSDGSAVTRRNQGKADPSLARAGAWGPAGRTQHNGRFPCRDRGRLARNAMRNRLYTVRLGGYVDFATTKLFVTEKMPETPLARRFARFLSLSLSTTPSSVTCPFFTIIRMGLMTGMPYFSNPGDP